ncbi:hypothetical protein AAEP93_011496 [Penicillium crustosum]
MQPFRMMHSNARPHLIKPQSTRSGPSNCAKQVIIGLYGLPGAGKIFWLGNLQTALGNDDFRFYDSSDAIAAVTPGGDEILTNINRLETVIMKIGVLIWEHVRAASDEGVCSSPLKILFSSPLGYSYTAFREVKLLYEEALGDVEFEACCQTVASLIHIHSDIKQLLQVVGSTSYVQAVAVTCGIRSAREKVLERKGLSLTVKVIGDGWLRNGLLVTHSLKAELVSHLYTVQGLHIIAFGDSSLDLEMLKEAHDAIVVTGEEMTRSKSMEKALVEAIGKNGFQPRQAVLPQHVTPRLDTIRLPSVRLIDQHFIDSVLARYKRPYVYNPAGRLAKLLMTPMRNASISGPALREVHRRLGYYLAAEFCTHIIGLEVYPIPHVQGFLTDGYRLVNEEETLIVPLMRGGEAMAFGVNQAFPLCAFHHAKVPNGLHQDHLRNMVTIILVDFVVNTGKSVLELIRHIRSLHATIRIVVVAGVIADSTSRIAWPLG